MVKIITFCEKTLICCEKTNINLVISGKMLIFAPMNEILSSKIVKTNKEHRCCVCGHDFPARTKMLCTSSRGDSFLTLYTCMPCHESRTQIAGMVQALFPEKYPQPKILATKFIGSPDEYLEKIRKARQKERENGK
jgi:hypothetical protein